jgi:hypothetical protein
MHDVSTEYNFCVKSCVAWHINITTNSSVTPDQLESSLNTYCIFVWNNVKVTETSLLLNAVILSNGWFLGNLTTLYQLYRPYRVEYEKEII